MLPVHPLVQDSQLCYTLKTRREKGARIDRGDSLVGEREASRATYSAVWLPCHFKDAARSSPPRAAAALDDLCIHQGCRFNESDSEKTHNFNIMLELLCRRVDWASP